MKIYENDEIYVRALTESDIKKDAYKAWFYDQEVCKYNSHGKMSHGFYPEDILDDLSAFDNIIWAVIVKGKLVSTSATPEHTSTWIEPDIHIGNVVLSIDWINRNAEFTCIFGEKDYWGKGYCTQVLKWIIDHGFNKLNLHKIWLGTAGGNIGMNTSARRAGMVEECVLLEQCYLNGRWESIITYGLINENN